MTLPHVPATCSRCYALLSPEAHHVGDALRRLIQYAEPGVPWYQPKRTPLCQQEPQQPLDDQ